MNKLANELNPIEASLERLGSSEHSEHGLSRQLSGTVTTDSNEADEILDESKFMCEMSVVDEQLKKMARSFDMEISDACAAFVCHIVGRRVRDIVENSLQV
eukprot:SAG11_NODE_2825_length_2937_cov_89.577519_3_plen_101_part_00